MYTTLSLRIQYNLALLRHLCRHLLDELLVLSQQLPELREVLPLRLGSLQEPREALLPVLRLIASLPQGRGHRSSLLLRFRGLRLALQCPHALLLTRPYKSIEELLFQETYENILRKYHKLYVNYMSIISKMQL